MVPLRFVAKKVPFFFPTSFCQNAWSDSGTGSNCLAFGLLSSISPLPGDQEFCIWAFAFNTLFIPIAAFGKRVPLIAMLLMLVSSVAVLVNATRLKSDR